jgi:hypothetical protein
MIPEIILAIIFIIVLIKLLNPDLIKPPIPTGIISGGLTTVTGEPVVGATVSLYAIDNMVDPVTTALSDATGKYVLAAEPKGTYNITAVLANLNGTRLEKSKDITLAEDMMTVDLSLESSTTL